MERVNDASVHGVLSDDLLSLPVTVALGSNREDRNWNNMVGEVQNLVAELTVWSSGQKDGPAITQGALVESPCQRQANNVVKNYIVMQDHDTGEDMDSIHKKIEAKGLFAVLWNTYSHLKPISTIAETKFIAWRSKAKLPVTMDGAMLIEHMQRYMRETGKVQEDIVASIHKVERKLVQGGAQFLVHHKPMPRVRSLFVLRDPFDFSEGVSQAEAKNEWADRYRGLSKLLGLACDKSCTDPSRLMYLPRVPDAKHVPEGFEIRLVGGDTLDFKSVPRVSSEDFEKSDLSKKFDLSDMIGGRVNRNTTFKTPGLANFIREYGKDFEAATWMAAAGAEQRDQGVSKITFQCPNDDAHHNPGDPNDKGFVAEDASLRDNGFWMHCSHDSCKTEGGGDRAFFLDKACQNFGVENASELIAFCPEAQHEQAEEKKEEEKKVDELEEIISKLTPESPSSVIEDAIRRTCAMSAMDKQRARERIRVAIDVTKGVFKDVVADAERKHNESADTGDDNAFHTDPHPCPDLPDDPDRAEKVIAKVDAIWDHWPLRKMRSLSAARLLYINKLNPEIFTREEGGTMRLMPCDGSFKLEDVERGAWVAQSSDMGLDFKKATDDGEIEIDMPDSILKYLTGTNRLRWPVIERITKVPVFGAEGELCVAKGYNPEAKVYHEPSLPGLTREMFENLTDDDVEEAKWWLMQPIRDFPFSDCFAGPDPLPIRPGELDEDGHPLPNWERGKGSRAHAIAMILQPFVRSMIKGPCPNYHVDKPAIGSGANFLVDVASLIFEGTAAAVQTLAHDNAEIKKSITSFLRSGRPMLFIDNIQQRVESPDIAAALTAGVWTDRILGASEMVSIPIRCTWIMAGNRVAFNRDMMRRNCPIYLNAATPNPASDRPPDFYKYDIHKWVPENREVLVWACLVLIKRWVDLGRPNGPCMMQSFGEWSRVMSGILEVAGIPGFLDNRAAYTETGDDDAMWQEALAQRIVEKKGLGLFKADELYDAATAEGAAAAIFSGGGMGGGAGEKIDPTLGVPVRGRNENEWRESFKKLLAEQLKGSTARVTYNGATVKVCWVKRKLNIMKYGLELVPE